MSFETWNYNLSYSVLESIIIFFLNIYLLRLSQAEWTSNKNYFLWEKSNTWICRTKILAWKEMHRNSLKYRDFWNCTQNLLSKCGFGCRGLHFMRDQKFLMQVGQEHTIEAQQLVSINHFKKLKLMLEFAYNLRKG